MIGDDAYIGFTASVTAVCSVLACARALIGNDFYASDHAHRHNPCDESPQFEGIYSKGTVIIGANCCIGLRVSVLPRATLGEYCVVGPHSVITRSFPPFSMIAGIPARLIKTFDFGLGEWKAMQAAGNQRVAR